MLFRSEEEASQYLVELVYNLKTHKVLGKSNIERNALFIYAFSAFDGFMGSLLKCIYHNKPEIANILKMELTIEDILRYENTNDIVSEIIQSEITSIRRESYTEQFKILENKFDIKLREFEEWKDFIEASQRRNLITHCNGIVSNQYLKICKDNGFKCSDQIGRASCRERVYI